MFTGTCFRHAENTIYFFLTYRNTSSCMAYAITKAGVRWFLDSYPMPVPLNLMALVHLCQDVIYQPEGFSDSVVYCIQADPMHGTQYSD